MLCLGNLTSSAPYTFLRSIAPEFHAVKGDFDVEAFAAQNNNSQTQGLQDGGQGQRAAVGATAPLTKIVTHGDLRLGMIHGHTVVPPGDADVLLMQARQMDVDVLLWGGTHRFEAYELEGRFFINPGSATGAWSSGWWAEGEEPLPSFVLMDVSDLRERGVLSKLIWRNAGSRRKPRGVLLPAKDGRQGRGDR